MTNKASAAPGENREKSAIEIEVEYDAEFDVLDRQAQGSADSINRTLSAKYFGRSERFSNIEELRSEARKERELAQSEKKGQETGTDSGKSEELIARVADSASRLLEPQQMTLFEQSSGRDFVNDSMKRKFENEVNYEDFKIAYDLQTGKGAEPKFVVFESIENGDTRRFQVPTIIAKAILMPSIRSMRIRALHKYLFPNELPE